MFSMYANDENNEKWVNKNRKSAFILHLNDYIWKVIINKWLILGMWTDNEP